MKNLLYLFSIAFLMLQSCTTEDSKSNNDSSDVILVKRMVIDADNFGNFFDSYDFVYDGKKLVKATRRYGGSTVYTYSGNSIVRSEERDDKDKPTGEFVTYTYSNNRLSQLKWYSGNSLDTQQDFSYSTDGKLVTVINKGNSTSIERRYLDSNGNIEKIEYLDSNNLITNTEYRTYDTKNGIFKNVLGIVILDYKVYEKNNITSIRNEPYPLYFSDGIYKYEYDDQDFPILLTISQDYYFSHRSYQFFY